MYFCRLRKEDEIVGYEKEFGNRHYFSKDGYQWTGEPISYWYKDFYIGAQDRNNQHLFSEDIIQINYLANTYFLIGYDEILDDFKLINLSNDEEISKEILLDLNNKSKIKRIGFSFHQKT
ncbi:MAG: hypothetical protein JJT77_12100 [Crocinitomicaceae bacterium]|nr:hypothetical protein [Crocinitomicaceae bacterium]